MLLVGTGTIGKAIHALLSESHEVILASRNSGDVRMDISSKLSIEAAYQRVGKVDGVIVCGARSIFKPFDKLTDEDWKVSIEGKLMGQIQMVQLGLPFMNDKGSFTLTSGFPNRLPKRFSSAPAMVDGAIEGFAATAARDLPRGIRINVVSPGMVEESMGHYSEALSEGMKPIKADDVAEFYLESLEGNATGKTFEAWG